MYESWFNEYYYSSLPGLSSLSQPSADGSQVSTWNMRWVLYLFSLYTKYCRKQQQPSVRLEIVALNHSLYFCRDRTRTSQWGTDWPRHFWNFWIDWAVDVNFYSFVLNMEHGLMGLSRATKSPLKVIVFDTLDVWKCPKKLVSKTLKRAENTACALLT